MEYLYKCEKAFTFDNRLIGYILKNNRTSKKVYIDYMAFYMMSTHSINNNSVKFVDSSNYSSVELKKGDLIPYFESGVKEVSYADLCILHDIEETLISDVKLYMLFNYINNNIFNDYFSKHCKIVFSDDLGEKQIELKDTISESNKTNRVIFVNSRYKQKYTTVYSIILKSMTDEVKRNAPWIIDGLTPIYKEVERELHDICGMFNYHDGRVRKAKGLE